MLDIRNIHKQIKEIVSNNGDNILKENYNHYLTPFMISPIIEFDEENGYDENLYDDLRGRSGLAPTYARLAGWDIMLVADEFQTLLDEEYICICMAPDPDFHTLKVGIMFNDDEYNVPFGIGFEDNGDGTWEKDGRTYTQAQVEEYYLMNYIKPALKIARDNIMRIHQKFGGTIHDKQPSYWNFIDKEKEPEDTGDEYNEAYNPTLKEDYDPETDPEWMAYPLGSGEGDTYNIGKYDFTIRCFLSEEELYYELTIYDNTTDESLYNNEYDSWDYMIDDIKNWLHKRKDDENEPDTDGSELDESAEEENYSKDLVKVAWGDYETYYRGKYGFFIEAIGNDWDNEDEKYYAVSPFLRDKSLPDEERYDEEGYKNFFSWKEVVDYINSYGKPADDKDEPDTDGSELNETVFYHDDPIPDAPAWGYDTAFTYHGYDFTAVAHAPFDSQNYFSVAVYKNGVTDDDEAYITEKCFNNWDEVKEYVENFDDDPDNKFSGSYKHEYVPDTEPETDGSELDESRWDYAEPDFFDLPGPELNDEKTYKWGPYTYTIEHTEDDVSGEFYQLTMFKPTSEYEANRTGVLLEEIDNVAFMTWDECIRYMKNMKTLYDRKQRRLDDYLDDYDEPETDGSELDESVSKKSKSLDWVHNIPSADSGVKEVYYKYYTIDYECNEEEGVLYYMATLFNSEIEDVNDAYIKEFETDSWESLVNLVLKYINEHPLTDIDDDEIDEPETDGSELNESVEDKSIDKEEYEYGYTEAQKWYEEGNRFDHYDNDEVSDDFWEGFCDGWDDAKNDINKFEVKEPETDGSELNESNDNYKWYEKAPEIGDTVRIDEGNYIIFIEHIYLDPDDDEDEEIDDDKREYFQIEIGKKLDEDSIYVVDKKFGYKWEDCVRYVKKYLNTYIKEPETDGSELDESWLPGAEWLDEPIDIGYSKTYSYKGYDFAIEGIRDTDGDYYSLRIYIHDIVDDDDALVQEASFDTWDELAIYVRDYVDEHPLKKEETKEPEDSGDEYMEGKLDIKNIKKQINEIVEQANG